MVDSQLVEIMGRHRLIAELMSCGVEVAVPQRDRGIDLLAYVDLDPQNVFRAMPIQMKASLNASFSLDRKYEKFPRMIIAFVWWLSDSSRTRTYALTYDEALEIAHQCGYTGTASWRKGTYVVTRPGAPILARLEAYVATSRRWQHLLS